MKKTHKIVIGVLILVLLVSVAALSRRSELFQGRMTGSRATQTTIDYSRLYLYRNNVVSVVTSPVASVVASEVTSPAGTSQVPSVVTSPVASAIVINRTLANQVDSKKLQVLTAQILKSIAQTDYKKNPAKFQLSDQAKNEIIKLYEQQQ